MKYRKKPVVIDAFQLNSRGLVGEDWFWDAVSRNEIITYYFGKFHPEDAYCDIKTLEGTMRANTGDYIIRGVNGEIYPCKADIFEKTYELVESEETRNEALAKVVRCKDCKHIRHCGPGKVMCQNGKIHELDWYCADGERRSPFPEKGGRAVERRAESTMKTKKLVKNWAVTKETKDENHI